MRRAQSASAFILFVLLTFPTGCYRLRPSWGACQTSFEGKRRVDPADIAVPAGYRISPVAAELTFPTGAAFDNNGQLYVIESGYAYGEVWTTPRLLRIN